MGTCLSWGNREYHDPDNPQRGAILNAQALGAVDALEEIINYIEDIYEDE